MLKKMNKNVRGFTLVELMIVVAIIGILASIAVPNYKKYQAKTRTSEAKIALSGVYTAEKSFAVEYSTYTACVKNAGFEPEGYDSAAPTTGPNYYTIGFTAAPANGCGPGNNQACDSNMGVGAPACTGLTEGAIYFSAGKAADGSALTTVADLPATTVTNGAFTAGAAGAISDTGIDTWTMNQDKQLSQINPGY